MANGIVRFSVMPENPEVDMAKIETQAKELIAGQGAKGDVVSELKPLAFGLKQLELAAMFSMDDGKDFDTVAESIAKIEGVGNAEVTGMDLALG
jgi:translation elongation factor aEF-1 beta